MAYVSLAHGGTGESFRVAGGRCGVELPGTHNGCEAAAISASFAEAARLNQPDFAQFLRFYTVKPLYTGAARVLERVPGVSAFAALRLLSAGSLLLLGLLLRSWLRWRVSPAMASTLALCLLSSPPVLLLGRALLPDALLTVLLLAGTLALLRPWRRHLKSARWVGAGLLVASTLVRPDAALFAGALAAAMLWRSAAQGRGVRIAGLAAGTAAWLALLGWWTHGLPWRVQFVHAFLAWTPPADYARLHVSLADYARVMGSNGLRTVVFCLPVSLFLAALALYGARLRSSMRGALWAGLAALAVRIALFPGVEERYYVWFFLLAGLGAAESLSTVVAGDTSARVGAASD